MKKILTTLGTIAIATVNYTMAIVVQVPPAAGNADINVQNPVIQGDESTLFVIFQFINQYMWFFMGAIAMGVLVYG